MGRYDYWNDAALNVLKKSDLFQKYLLPDICRGSVFPAIRGKKIDFYHAGRKLFSYSKNRFRSNIAYVVACQNAPKGEVYERDLANLRLCTSFQEGYKQIRRNTTLYADPESEQVARLCKNHSYCLSNSGTIVALDIELSLNATEDGKSDRIDLILFNSDSKELRFFEVKTFQNREIRASEGQVPVVAQIGRYKGQIVRRNEELLDNYEEYIGIVNNLFGMNLPVPNKLCQNVGLLVCGYKKNEEKDLKDKVFLPISEAKIPCRSIGDAGSVTQKTLQKWWSH